MSAPDLLAYFMVHAPSEPQAWFEPVMPAMPKVPQPSQIQDERIRKDVQGALRAESDPELPESAKWMAMQKQAFSDYASWSEEHTKQRLVQWPRAWACEQCAQYTRYTGE